MTASTTTSTTSRRSVEAPDSMGGAVPAAPECGAAMSLGEELRAHSFKLLAARIPKFDPSAVETARELDRKADLRLDVGRDRAQLGGRVNSQLLARPICPDPIFGLAHGQVTRDHHLEPVFLRGLTFQCNYRPSMSRGDHPPTARAQA